MKLIKRIVADIRGPGITDSEVDMMVNKDLIELQSNDQGERNPNVKIIEIQEIIKDSGILVFVVLYEDKGLDVKPIK